MGKEGGKFENRIKQLLNSNLPKKYIIRRGTSGSEKLSNVQKEPDFLIIKKGYATPPLLALECKYVSKPTFAKQSMAKYWTQIARGYTLLHDLKTSYPKISCYLIFSFDNKDKMDYRKLCKRAKIKYFSIESGKNQFLKEIKKIS